MLKEVQQKSSSLALLYFWYYYFKTSVCYSGKQLGNVYLHPGVTRASTRVYLLGRSGCRRFVHPGGRRILQLLKAKKYGAFCKGAVARHIFYSYFNFLVIPHIINAPTIVAQALQIQILSDKWIPRTIDIITPKVLPQIILNGLILSGFRKNAAQQKIIGTIKR